MRDATGATQSVLVLGGNSDLAGAVVERLVAARTRRVVLAARDVERAAERSTDLATQGHPDLDIAVVEYDALDPQAHGRVFSSVAGARVRPENAAYGAAKAGLDSFAQAIADTLHGSGVHVMIVRPGFVHTKMTEGRPVAPFATTADAVAEDVMNGLRKGKRVVWSPGTLRYVFTALKALPGPLWRRVAT